MKKVETAVNTNEKADSEQKAHYEMYKEKLKKLTIMSDIFMRNVFKKKECTQYALQVIMDDETLQVKEHTIQQDYKNLHGRSGVLDCVAIDTKDKQYDLEIEQEKKRASPERGRYHGGLIDTNTLNPGEDFENLPETNVIFVTRKDTSGKGLPIYHFDRKCKETDEEFKDKLHIIMVNGENTEDTKLGRLMHDFHCTDAKDMYSEILASKVRELKETPEGVEYMCKEMDEIYKMGEARGEARGELKKAKKTAISLSNMGLPVEQIAQAVEVSLNLVQEWIAGGMVPAK